MEEIRKYSKEMIDEEMESITRISTLLQSPDDESKTLGVITAAQMFSGEVGIYDPIFKVDLWAICWGNYLAKRAYNLGKRRGSLHLQNE